MGCALSKPEEEDDVVSICRERKRLMKSAVQRRCALADAQCRYNHSLYAVAAAIRLFVAKHSSQCSPFLVNFPPSCSDPTEIMISNPLFIQQTPSEQPQKTISCKASDFSVSLESNSNVERVEQDDDDDNDGGRSKAEAEEELFGQFYCGMGEPKASPRRDFRWDFFSSFYGGMRTELGNVNGLSQSSDDELKAIREREGIPELEEDEGRGEEKNDVMGNNVDVGNEEIEAVRVDDDGRDDGGDDDDDSQWKHDSFRMIDTPENGRELLEALKDVEDHFTRAYNSGLEVSKLLEVNIVHLQSGTEEIKESSNKLIQSITLHRTSSSWSSSRSTSRKSFLPSGSRKSLAWTEFKNDLFDESEAMKSGSHSLTLRRLYEWEKKLYKEVKAGDNTRKIYERKCTQLRDQDAMGDDLCSQDKTRAEVKDLYSRILVAIRSAETISERIQTLRDKELQPQIVELLQGLMRSWKIMLESHETQNKAILEVKSFNSPTYGKFCNDSHRLATLQLEAELQNWRDCFAEYVSAQKAYVEALNGWLSKFLASEFEAYCQSSVLQCQINGLTLLVICHDWLASFDNLSDKAVIQAMKSFAKDIRALWVQQGEEQMQKRKVDGLAKELDQRVQAFQKAESRILESKHAEHKSEMGVRNRVEFLTERKDHLDKFRQRVDAEKAKHQSCMQETQRITLNGFQTGFPSVLQSLSDFSKASVKMYNDLITYKENTEVRDLKANKINS